MYRKTDSACSFILIFAVICFHRALPKLLLSNSWNLPTAVLPHAQDNFTVNLP